MKKANRNGSLFLLMGAAALLLVSMLPLSCTKEPPPPKPECETSADCPAGRECEGGRCIRKAPPPPPPECTSNEDCSNNKICVNNKCKYECQSNADCGSNEICENNRCTEPRCELQTVNFDFDEYYLTSDAQRQLRDNAECIKKRGFAAITIEGHCDERGSLEYNLSLGQKRAESVRNYLSDMGVERSKIKVISYGEERPVDSASNEDAWAKNRRAETLSR